MSKSLGNFITLRACLEKFGTDASRVALADAGDSLDDGNFEDETANAAILKLFTFEQWVKKQFENVDTLDFAQHKTEEYDTWDKIFVNEIAKCVSLCTKNYNEMKYRNVLKHGFNEMLSLKESYLIGKSNKPNPFILLNFVEAFLIMLNPITPHFCQNLWQS